MDAIIKNNWLQTEQTTAFTSSTMLCKSQIYRIYNPKMYSRRDDFMPAPANYLTLITATLRKLQRGEAVTSTPESGRCKGRMKGDVGGQMKACSWADRSLENSHKAQENWEDWGRSSGTVTAPVRGRPPQPWCNCRKHTDPLSGQLQSDFPPRSQGAHIRVLPYSLRVWQPVTQEWQLIRKCNFGDETECLA